MPDVNVPQPDAASPLQPIGWSGVIRATPRSRHFCVAAGLLLVVALGWTTAAHYWKIYLIKKPVMPPVGTNVNKKQRLVNFPTRLGSYELAEKSVAELAEDVLESLGTTGNPHNWYYMAAYVDKKTNEAVQVDVTYYTGLRDAVPHVGERCILAQGGTVDYTKSGSVDMTLSSLPSAWKSTWSHFKVYRTAYEISGQSRSGRFCQYHVFSMNGTPTDDWKTVRGKLTLPWVKYCYFAKIQIAPLAPDLSEEANDKVCQRFLSAALPAVMKFLPTEQDVENVQASGE